MDTSKTPGTWRGKLRSKRVLIPAVATVAVLGVGAVVWSATANDVRGDERDRVAAAAVEAAGGGRVTDVETSDDPGEAYEVEVRQSDGTEIDVALDEDLAVVTRDRDDRMLSASERDRAGQAALAAVGGGEVLKVEAGDDGPEAYEVEVLDAKSVQWEVELGAGFTVLSKKIDD